jgi:Tfp pilus assembly protein PilN
MDTDKRINLLPLDLSANSASVKIKNAINTLAIISTTALFICIFAFVGLYIYNNNKLKLLVVDNSKLKNQITSLEASEQKLVLAKDRLGKIKDIMENNSAQDEIALYKEISKDIDPAIQISEVGLESSKLETSLLTPDSRTVGTFFNKIITLKTVKKIMLTTLTYNPSTGYLAGLVFTTGGSDE